MSRARLFDLFARREAARAAGLGRATARAATERAEAEATGDHLRRLGAGLDPGAGQMVAASLRTAGLLGTDLRLEADRQDARAANAAAEVARLQALIAGHERRREFADAHAAAARAAEAEAALARAEAAQPPRRPR